MTTQVEFHFVLPTGEPVANATAEVQLARSSYNDDDDGITMPRPITFVTDEDGKGVLDLWPSTTTMYYVSVLDTESEAGLSYKFLVPEVAPGTVLRLQDLVVDTPPVGQNYAEATLTAIQQAKAEAISAKGAAEAAAAEAVAAVSTIEDVSADAAAAASSAAAAQASASDASDSADDASTHATSANGSASAAAASAAAASTSASQADASASAAASSQTSASAAVGTATTKAAEAAASASAAAGHVTAAQGHATTAGTSATNAANAASAAAGSAASALAVLDSFDDRYLGAKASAPTVDNDGNALVQGTLYFDTVAGSMFVYNGSAWASIGSGGGGGGGDVTSVAGRTGIVVLTKSDVGLGNADNTSDTNKPVSTAQQAALDAKLSLAGGTVTGNVVSTATPSAANHLVSKGYVDAAVASATGDSLVTVEVSGTAHTAEAGQLVVMGNAAQSICFAPTTPAPGDTFAVTFGNGRLDNVLGYSGHALLGQNENLSLDVGNVIYTFRYISSSLHWKLD